MIPRRIVVVLGLALAACRSETRATGDGPELAIGAASVRACDLLLDTGDTAPHRVRFGSAVRGEVAAQAPHLAVSVFTRGDRAFPPGAVMFETATPRARLVRAACFDRDGKPVSDPGVQIR